MRPNSSSAMPLPLAARRPATFLGVVLVLGLLFAPAGPLAAQSPTAPDGLQPLETNRDLLVEMAVVGYIAAPRQAQPPYRVAPDGTVRSLPGTGSITYNFRVGDSAVNMAGDHVEPAVSISTDPTPEETGLNVLAQIGNRVRVVSGDAKGAEGTVIGKHGGIENVMVEFPDEVYDELVIGDRMQIRAVGLGLEALNVEDLYIRNMSPTLLDAMTEAGMAVTADGRLRVPVTHRIPAMIMGSGLGRNHVHAGDYDIQMFDQDVVAEYNLDTLRFGDIVAIMDADHAHGRIYRSGAISIGVVVHGISRVAGHGPGVTTLLTSPSGNIHLVDDPDMNLASLLNLR